MHREQQSESGLKTRLFYGGVVGAFLGMIIGTMPANEPIVGLLSMGVGATLISGLAALSDNFWESLRSAWELVRIAFWRW
jgi:hypothetical protein